MVLNAKNQLLLAKRRDPITPAADNKWEFIGGKIEWGESPEAAVVREAKEESGLDVKIVRLLPKVFSNSWKKVKDGTQWEVQTFLLTYECRVVGGELLSAHDPKISELKFVDILDLENYDLLPNVREMVEVLTNNIIS